MAGRNMTITEMVTFVTEECYAEGCGVLWAMESNFRKYLVDNPGRAFYCPNGHRQWYQGKTEAQKQRERAERLERQLANRDEDLRSARASLTATKGQLTKARNQVKRAERGVCPHCTRHFVNVERHVERKHPDVLGASG